MMDYVTGLMFILFILLLLVIMVAIIATMYSKEIYDNNRNILIPILSFVVGFLISSILSITLYVLFKL